MGKYVLTANQLARKLQLRPETIRLWARKGLIPSLKPTPKTIRFELESVLQALRDAAKKNSIDSAQDTDKNWK